MATQNKGANFRLVIQKLMQNIQILYQNGEITVKEKNELCQLTKQALQTNCLTDLHSRFKGLRYGTLFGDVIDDCIQLTNH